MPPRRRAPPPPTTGRSIASASQMRSAWNWLVTTIPNRPSPGPSHVYDDLSAWTDSTGRLLHHDRGVIGSIATLYLVSSFASHSRLLEFINGGNPFDVTFPTASLDPALKRVLETPARFRASLAEHLGFWIPVASTRRQRPSALIAASQPHTLPEDTGPDALVVEARPRRKMELVSIKNSTRDPARMVASAGFRAGRKPRSGPCLDEFHSLITKHEGFTKVLRLVASACSYAGVTMQERLQLALITDATYHAFVVASHEHCEPAVFDGFARVSNQAARRIGTYVGSNNWTRVAANVRTEVVRRIRAIGAW